MPPCAEAKFNTKLNPGWQLVLALLRDFFEGLDVISL